MYTNLYYTYIIQVYAAKEIPKDSLIVFSVTDFTTKVVQPKTVVHDMVVVQHMKTIAKYMIYAPTKPQSDLSKIGHNEPHNFPICVLVVVA